MEDFGTVKYAPEEDTSCDIDNICIKQNEPTLKDLLLRISNKVDGLLEIVKEIDEKFGFGVYKEPKLATITNYSDMQYDVICRLTDCNIMLHSISDKVSR